MSKRVSQTSRLPDSDLPDRRSQGVHQSSKTEIVEVSKRVSISGPLPPPLVLKQYDELVPGSAERVIQMAEKSLDHQIDFSSAALQATVASTKRGQVMGFVTVLVALVGSMIAIFADQAAVAQILGGGTVIGLAAIFVLGRLPAWLKSFRDTRE